MVATLSMHTHVVIASYHGNCDRTKSKSTQSLRITWIIALVSLKQLVISALLMLYRSISVAWIKISVSFSSRIGLLVRCFAAGVRRNCIRIGDFLWFRYIDASKKYWKKIFQHRSITLIVTSPMTTVPNIRQPQQLPPHIHALSLHAHDRKRTLDN